MTQTKNTQQKIPKLRFSEFFWEWEEKKLEEVLINYRLWWNYQNSEKKTENVLIKMWNLWRWKISLKKIHYIEEWEDIFKIDKIKYWDLFFNTRNTLELVWKVSIWRNEIINSFYNSNLMLMNFKNNFFMNYKFNSFDWIKKLKSLATWTTSVAAIYTKDLLKLKFNLPQLPEQQKIALFLSSVDEKIESLKKKKELFEEYKKGVMQKIFKQEIRFKDENGENFGEWEEKKLGEIWEFKTSSVDKKLVKWEKEIFLLNYMDVYKHKDINNKNKNDLMIVTAKDNQRETSNLKKWG